MASKKFYIPVDLRYTALILADIQNEILARFAAPKREQFLQEVHSIVQSFRTHIAKQRTIQSTADSLGAYEGIPLIIHHVLPYGYNNNAFVSPYNKLGAWVKSLQDKGFFSVPEGATNPATPVYSIPEILLPEGGKFGTSTDNAPHHHVDEVLVAKVQTSSFGSSDLLGYLRARGIRHIILCGLTTVGAILGSARQGADLDFHIVIPRSGVMDDEDEVNEFVLERVLPKFVDVVNTDDVRGLFT